MAVRSKIDKVIMTIFKSRPYITDIYIPISDKVLDEEIYEGTSRLHGRMCIIATKHEDSIVWYYSRCFDTRIKGDKSVGRGYIPFKANIPTIKDIVLDSIKRNNYFVDYAYAVKIFSPTRFIINAGFMFPLGIDGIVNYKDMEFISSYTRYREYVNGNVELASDIQESIEKAYWLFDSQRDSPLTIIEYDKLKDKEPHTKARNLVTTMRANLAKLKKETQMYIPAGTTQQKLI